MLIVSKGQSVSFRFLFATDGVVYDPIDQPIPEDITVSIIRGERLAGSIVMPAISYLFTFATPDPNIYISKEANSEFVFHYKIPENIFPGIYTVIAKTIRNGIDLFVESRFEVKESAYEPFPTVPLGNRSAVVTYRPTYQDINQSNTSSIMLIGHADNVKINNPIKIKSIQNAVDLIGSDSNSPLLRGVFDAYYAGAQDIFICAAAPMSEYIFDIAERNTAYPYLLSNDATPVAQTFYQKYYERLEETYSIIKDLDYIDVVVPLETSFLNTGSVDFLTQLVNYCKDFHNYTGFVQIGIMGALNNGVSASDVDTLESDPRFVNRYTLYNINGSLASDHGRYVIPVYGEAMFSHTIQQLTYTNSVAAAYAGLLVSTPLNMGLIRKRLPGAMSLYGSDLTSAELQRLDQLGINTIFRGNKARRGRAFEVYVTNDYTLANLNSVFSKTPQLRLVALLASEVKGYGYDAIGKFGYDKVVSNVSSMLTLLKNNKVISDFEFKAKVSETERGVINLYINVISSLGLKQINLSLAAGPGA